MTSGDEALGLGLQPLDRGFDIARRAAGRRLLAEHVPGFERLADFQFDATMGDAAIDGKAEFPLRLEPFRLEGVAGAGKIGDDAAKILPDEMRQHETVVQAGAPAHRRASLRLAPEPGDERANEQMLGEAHARVGRPERGRHAQLGGARRTGRPTRGREAAGRAPAIAAYATTPRLHRPARCGKRGGARSVAQLVEHRSPKPGVGGSSPSSPASDSFQRWRYRRDVKPARAMGRSRAIRARTLARAEETAAHRLVMPANTGIRTPAAGESGESGPIVFPLGARHGEIAGAGGRAQRRRNRARRERAFRSATKRFQRLECAFLSTSRHASLCARNWKSRRRVWRRGGAALGGKA